MGLMEDLGRGPAGVETAILIYFIERASPVSPSGRAVVSCADRGRIELTTSALTCSQAAMTQFLRAAVVYVWLTSRAIICALQPNSERQAESKFPLRYNWRPL
jgi:hypothetical protein